jgi:arylsulfatase A-like enzyme
MPSRASLLTGLLPHAIESMTMAGVYPGSTYDPAKCPFWPAVFRQNGYHTAQIGKWHTGTDTGYGRDWDFQIVWNRPGHPENAGNYYTGQILSVSGQERLVDGYSTDNYTRWAVEYIEGKHREPGKPWYLWLCYGAVHGPTTPADRHQGKYAGNEAPVPADIIGPWPDKPKYLERTSAWERGRDGKVAMKSREKRQGNFDTDQPGLKYDDWVQQVNECAMAIDEGVAQVMAALERSGQLKNTLVVYTADQGYALGEHGFSQKVAPYDATIASPLIVSRPGVIPEGKVCRHPVNAPDLVALFCNVADIQPTWKMHGRDIRPLLADPENADWDSPMLFTHTGRSYGSDTREVPTDARLTDTANTPWYAMLRDGRYKYIRTLVRGETEEIYDLASDPEELTNLAADPLHRTLLETLRARTIEQLRQTDAGFADSMPPTKAMLAARTGADE